jgi:hypothetical protein
MDAIVAKLPEELHVALDAVAKKTRRTRSAVLRDALTMYLRAESDQPSSALSHKFADYSGVFEGGPKDLSTNPKHLAGYGLSRR